MTCGLPSDSSDVLYLFFKGAWKCSCIFRIECRLYASEASQVLEAMKKNPLVVIPIVLTRLEAKADEWRKAKERNSKTWNELNQKYYLKSLDHQGVNFKQTDTKLLRSKALIQELTNVYDERVCIFVSFSGFYLLNLAVSVELIFEAIIHNASLALLI